MIASDLLGVARAAHSTILGDVCEARRSFRGSLDESSGKYISGQILVYSGPCRLKAQPTNRVDLAGTSASLARHTLELPHGSAKLQPKDVVSIDGRTASYVVFATRSSSTSTIDEYVVEEVS